MSRAEIDRRERRPTRTPGEGGIELESTAGNLQVKPAETASLVREALPGDRKRKWRRRRGRRVITYKPGDLAPASGVYNVVDKRGKYVHLQITCHANKPFPPPYGSSEPREYELAYEAIHLSLADEPVPFPPQIHRPGERVPVSGIYNVVDEQGRYLFDQRALVEQRQTFDPLGDPRAYGYALAFPARHLAHGPERDRTGA